MCEWFKLLFYDRNRIKRKTDTFSGVRALCVLFNTALYYIWSLHLHVFLIPDSSLEDTVL